jgi:hypothetical protein
MPACPLETISKIITVHEIKNILFTNLEFSSNINLQNDVIKKSAQPSMKFNKKHPEHLKVGNASH